MEQHNREEKRVTISPRLLITEQILIGNAIILKYFCYQYFVIIFKL